MDRGHVEPQASQRAVSYRSREAKKPPSFGKIYEPMFVCEHLGFSHQIGFVSQKVLFTSLQWLQFSTDGDFENRNTVLAIQHQGRFFATC
jgi:hypothetical protein